MPATGPYETERHARGAAHAVVAPGPGQVILDRGGNIRLLFLALEDTGVATGSHENKIAGWLANYEDSTMAVIAGWIRRAFEAGKAAGPDGAVTEWGVRFRDDAGHVSAMAECGRGPEGEQTARSIAGTSKRDNLTGIVFCREVGPWKEAPEGVTG